MPGSASHRRRATRAVACAIAACWLTTGCQWLPARDATRHTADVGIVTFNRDIAPIPYENCVTRHRPAATPRRAEPAPAGLAVPPRDGELCVAGAPFSPLDYASAHAYACDIADATRRRAMPPWLPEARHARFVNERCLSDEEITFQTDSHNAEFERATVYSNFIPKEGSNQFRGSFLSRYAGEGWQSDDLSDALIAQGLRRGNRIWDVNPAAGGPIVRDRLWVYASYRHWGTYNTVAGSFKDRDFSALFYEPSDEQADVRPGLAVAVVIMQSRFVDIGVQVDF